MYLKELALFLVGVVVVCVVIAKVTGLHDVDTSERGKVDGTVSVATLLKRDRDDIEFKRVTVSGTAGQINRYESYSHLLISDGDATLYCALPKSYERGDSNVVIAEGVVTYEKMTNLVTTKDTDQLVLRDCKIK